MIGSLHWSLIALLELCFGCALLNFVQWRVTGATRLSGVLICLTWAVQQTWWVATGEANLPLTLACDSLLLWFFWTRRASNSLADLWIAALIPATMLIYIPAAIYGETLVGWWLNRILVAVQMLLGWPTLWRQKIGGNVTHGKLRRA